MANSTSKSSKPKTKTASKSVAAKTAKTTKTTKKPSKEVKANKVVAKAAPKSASAIATKEVNKEAKVRRAARALTAEGLRRWHLVSAIVFALLAVIAGVFMNDTSAKLFRGHLTSDALTSQTQTVFAPAQYVVANLEIRWLVVATLVVSALFAAWRYYRVVRERQALDSRIAAWRWIDFAVTGALLVETVAFLSGMQEVVSLKLLGSLVAASAIFAWIAERENANATRVVKGAFAASFVAGALSLMALNAYAVATVVYGLIRSPWYLYALYVVVVAAALLLALNQIRTYRRAGSWANYLYAERNYIVLNLVTKVAFAVILTVGLLK